MPAKRGGVKAKKSAGEEACRGEGEGREVRRTSAIKKSVQRREDDEVCKMNRASAKEKKFIM